MDLALNNLQRLICYKTQQTNQPTNQPKLCSTIDLFEKKKLRQCCSDRLGQLFGRARFGLAVIRARSVCARSVHAFELRTFVRSMRSFLI